MVTGIYVSSFEWCWFLYDCPAYSQISRENLLKSQMLCFSNIPYVESE